MTIETILDEIHLKVIRNIWLQRFTLFNRMMLAAAFVPSGLKKIMGERFTIMPIDNPVGFFFEALYQTGFYYNFIGWVQVIVAILLMVPRTSTLGAVISFPVVLNICLITISVGFRGTWVITLMMTLANLYLLCWDYDKIKAILPFRHARERSMLNKWAVLEGIAWGMLGGGLLLFVMLIGAVRFREAGVLGILAVIAGGAAFGFLAAWQRQRLKPVE